MLATQVSYWNYKENQRHNIQTEFENVRHNKRSEELIDFSNRETQRHNLKTESQTDWYNSETQRHNLATENIGYIQANAAQQQAKAALLNANTNRLNGFINLLSYQSQNTLNKQLGLESQARTDYTKTKDSLEWQRVGQGWISAVSGAASAIR